MAALTVAGTIAAGVYGGWAWAAGFITGAVFSGLNFWFWHRLVAKVGERAEERQGSGSIMLFALRYGAFAAGLYVILKYSEASLSAALSGIFVAVAAVLLEIVFELIYGT